MEAQTPWGQLGDGRPGRAPSTTTSRTPGPEMLRTDVPASMQLARGRLVWRAVSNDHGKPRIGLNAPGTVSTLTAKGFSFAKHRVEGDDESGNRTWWFDYELLDRVVSVVPVELKREAIAA